MRLMLLVETAVLLAASQLVLGIVGYLVRGIPWLGLLLVLFLCWMIVRTARVLREEMIRAARRGVPLTPWATALFVAVLWQVPVLLCLPYWAPAFGIRIWAGAFLSIPGTLQLIPSLSLPADPLLWAAVPAEMALFLWAAGKALAVRTMQPQAQVAAARMPGGNAEWVPARRHKDVPRRRTLEPGDQEPRSKE